MHSKAVLENVRRYRTIASLCRQTAAFRPTQKWTLLEQAFEWERLAMTEARRILYRFRHRVAVRGDYRCLIAAKKVEPFVPGGASSFGVKRSGRAWPVVLQES